MAAIEVANLTKEYRLGVLQSLKRTLLNTGARLIGRAVADRPLFKALDDVSFAVEPGEVVGIIGHNGAGKSTLLKMLTRISTPTSGTVRVNGRIAPLIEVGAGFIPDFTGRENVYLNGIILGMSKKEIHRKFDGIVDFAEMAQFIDTPVKRYSSGMQVRLAFAVATSVESEILIVDEVLAVGDLAFQRKCFDRMEHLIKQHGRTVLLVSHNIRQVERMCRRVLLLDRGRVIMDGPASHVCNAFYEENDRAIVSQQARTGYPKVRGTGEVDLLDIYLTDDKGDRTAVVQYGNDMHAVIRLAVHRGVAAPVFVFGIHTTDFVYITTATSQPETRDLHLSPGIHEIRLKVRDFPLLPGAYSVRFSLDADDPAKNILYGDNLFHFSVASGAVQRTAPSSEGFFVLRPEWRVDHCPSLP